MQKTTFWEGSHCLTPFIAIGVIYGDSTLFAPDHDLNEGLPSFMPGFSPFPPVMSEQ